MVHKLPGLVQVEEDSDTMYLDVGIYGLLGAKKIKQVGSALNVVKKFEKYCVDNNG